MFLLKPYYLLAIALVSSAGLFFHNLNQCRDFMDDRFKQYDLPLVKYLFLDKKYFSDPGWEYRNKAIWFPVMIFGTVLALILLLSLFDIRVPD
jgi:hypothetical protein